jgi:hypothetical protein
MAKKKSKHPSGTAAQAPKETRAEWMFRAAASFEWAHLLLVNDTRERAKKRGTFSDKWHEGDPIAILTEWIPMMVNGMLAIEIYFKCMQTLDTNTHGWGHECDLLFSALGITWQKRVKSIYGSKGLGKRKTLAASAQGETEVDVSLENILKESSRLFDEGRYWFDTKHTWSIAAPTEIAAAARLAILEVKPQWEQIFSTVGQLST